MSLLTSRGTASCRAAVLPPRVLTLYNEVRREAWSPDVDDLPPHTLSSPPPLPSVDDGKGGGGECGWEFLHLSRTLLLPAFCTAGSDDTTIFIFIYLEKRHSSRAKTYLRYYFFPILSLDHFGSNGCDQIEAKVNYISFIRNSLWIKKTISSCHVSWPLSRRVLPPNDVVSRGGLHVNLDWWLNINRGYL